MVYTLLLLTKAINKLYNSRPHLWNSVPSPPLYANFYLTFLPEYKLFLFCVYLGLSSPRLGNKCTPQQKCPNSTDIGLDFWQSKDWPKGSSTLIEVGVTNSVFLRAVKVSRYMNMEFPPMIWVGVWMCLWKYFLTPLSPMSLWITSPRSMPSLLQHVVSDRKALSDTI